MYQANTAQWFDDKLLGSCADIECPSGHGKCRISNQTYNLVGVDTFSFNSSNSRSENLTWSTAFHDYTGYDPDMKAERTIEKSFFLGTPESVNLTSVTGWGGCAVILEAYNKVLDNIRPSSRKTCEDVIGGDCHKELREDTLRFARDQGNRFNSSSDACDGLEEYLQSVSGVSNCKMNWTQVHYIQYKSKDIILN
ncbi:hypothetical protein DM02DRAFT_682972 [Periconia macrospinosa]|uniref:Uncharacterized protein n=1 Tax=Periconia macrospinosa TaxID=97972 RepID=A0A2V1E668_9PLEO|nr:hypothetical protein DM02DRAFT_682972 [Periconia macrospinosa]